MQAAIAPSSKGKTWAQWIASVPIDKIGRRSDLETWILRQGAVRAEKEAAKDKRRKAA